LSTVNRDSVELWYGELTADDLTYHRYWPLLDTAEHAHAQQLTNPLIRQRYVQVHGRLRSILSRYLGRPPERINIKKAEYGKPYLADYPELAFNLSHAANSLVIAVAYDCRLGVDIEHCKPRSNLPQLVAKCFADDEADYWHNLPEEQKNLAFYRFWTRKEAFVKATGRGIALGLSQCVINPGNQASFLNLPAEFGQTRSWRISAIQLATRPSLCGAIVADKAVTEINLHDFEISAIDP